MFSIVVQRGSMAKAAAQLGVSQPSVSEVIADLAHALGVRLLDRSAQGIEPTIYASALLKRSLVAFDELKQGSRESGTSSSWPIRPLVNCGSGAQSPFHPRYFQRSSNGCSSSIRAWFPMWMLGLLTR